MARDIPIIFSAPMVRALLDGRKTQTRRLVPQPPAECGINYMLGEESWLPIDKRTPVRRAFEAWTGPLFQNRPAGHLCGSFDITPRFQPRDRLWVRENFSRVPSSAYRQSVGVEQTVNPADQYEAAIYAANWDRSKPSWKPSIHMPRWASRLTLVVEGVKVERLQDISEEDARAEGCIPDDGGLNPNHFGPARSIFEAVWTHLHGPDAWDANPWVVAISFSVHRGNIDKLPAQAGEVAP